ncbi:hypothetical protein Glove_495g10 [Diversispora epigaea]|uniref:Uncharacterized protein n=1 Tax=Diversispora epigaea TaxID=1348612 RepID=A0A397GHX1_9GLOM|nr:hypothetical protein Glove_495g10 [Diversispora epigaea]
MQIICLCLIIPVVTVVIPILLITLPFVILVFFLFVVTVVIPILLITLPFVILVFFLFSPILALIPFIRFCLMSFSTSDKNFLELTTPLTSEVPACFKGLEKPWAELIKDGRDFRKETWFETHIKFAKKENITPLEHFAKFVRRAEKVLQEDEKEPIDCGDAPSSTNNSDSRCSSRY